FRLLVWGRFLAQVSKLKLRLVPTHPDRLGGLGFLLASAHAFIAFALANGVLLAGWLAVRVVVRGGSLLTFREEILAVPVFVTCVCVAPFLMFTRTLILTKRLGIQEYGALASRYSHEFDDKWISGNGTSEPLVGSADIQSLADMGGSYDIVQSMR